MLENFELISSLGCCCRAGNVEAQLEENIAVRVSQAKNPKLALSSQKSHPCESCGLVLRNIFHLTEQQELQHRQILLRCGACTKQFHFHAQFHQHQEQHCREKPLKRSMNSISGAKGCHFNVSQKLFTCGEVGQDICTESGHPQQEATQTRDRRNDISMCAVTFPKRKTYCSRKECKKANGCNHTFLQDKGVHTGKDCFSCSECGKSFTSSTGFHCHQKIHTGDRPYQCSECGKTFTTSNGFRYHQRVHTGERPYQCSECGKSFIASTHLHRHQRVHTGERPYDCSECRKSFTWKVNLCRHQRVHTGERPYVCNECGKSFTDRKTELSSPHVKPDAMSFRRVSGDHSKECWRTIGIREAMIATEILAYMMVLEKIAAS
ncbi:zinc finger protein 211-like [Myotis lucifugus]|uniref:zinc finger protein 211-like n=1 Tax=Myotis lucifugus TaxID=59463 RepID=UPI000CCC1B55|nr:zinc finger protein 211-like [Myotis lucifugus]